MPFTAALALDGCLAAGIGHACDRLADRHDDDDDSGHGHGGNRSAARPPRTGRRQPLVIVAPSMLALAVSTGLRVMTAMFEEDVTQLCGLGGKHNPDRGPQPRQLLRTEPASHLGPRTPAEQHRRPASTAAWLYT
jgi:hypothetical protein